MAFIFFTTLFLTFNLVNAILTYKDAASSNKSTFS